MVVGPRGSVVVDISGVGVVGTVPNTGGHGIAITISPTTRCSDPAAATPIRPLLHLNHHPLFGSLAIGDSNRHRSRSRFPHHHRPPLLYLVTAVAYRLRPLLYLVTSVAYLDLRLVCGERREGKRKEKAAVF
ncbi:hypothetical protein LINPERPRIM_LOCUS19179 [Linum perenne]